VHPLRLAMTAHDRVGVASALAADVVLWSPITRRPFRGRDEVAAVLMDVLAVIDQLEYVHDAPLRDGAHLLASVCRVRGRPLEIVDLVRHDEDGHIREITVLTRPIAGTARLASALGPRLARRRHSRVRAATVKDTLGP
jgi:hypothetical protein